MRSIYCINTAVWATTMAKLLILWKTTKAFFWFDIARLMDLSMPVQVDL